MVSISVQLKDAEGTLYRVECQSDSAVEAFKELQKAVEDLRAEGLTPQREAAKPVVTPQPNGKPAGEWVDDPEQMKNFQKLLEYRNVDLNSGLKLTGSPSWRSYASSELALKAVDAKLDTKEGADEALDVDDVPDDLGGYLKKSQGKEPTNGKMPEQDREALKERCRELYSKGAKYDILKKDWNNLADGYTESDLEKAEEKLDRLIAQKVISSELRASLQRFPDTLKEKMWNASRKSLKLDDGRHELVRNGKGKIEQDAPLLLQIIGETEAKSQVIAGYVSEDWKARVKEPVVGVVNDFMGKAYSDEATKKSEAEFFEVADIYAGELGEQTSLLLAEARKEPMTRDRWMGLTDKLNDLAEEQKETAKETA